MHPVDVAALVGEEAEAISTILHSDSTFGVDNVALDGVLLDVAFSKPVHQIIETAQPSGLLHVSGAHYIKRGTAVALTGTARRLILRLDVEDFDGQPPTAALHDGDGEPLDPDAWPRDLPGRGIIRCHPVYRRPFFCRRGLREYHSHPGHEADPWDRHREQLSLSDIVVELMSDLSTRWRFGA